jgi:hypothetical protein
MSGMDARVLAPLVAVAMALVAGGGAEARSTWSKPQQIGPTQQVFGGVAMASDRRGDRILVWATAKNVQVALARDGGPFGRAKPIRGSMAESGGLQVAIDGRGHAVAAWQWLNRRRAGDNPCCVQVQAALIDHGRVGRAQVLGGGDRSEQLESVALGPDGRTVVATAPGTVYTATRRGSFASETIPAPLPNVLSAYFRGGRLRLICVNGSQFTQATLFELVRVGPNRYTQGRELVTEGVNHTPPELATEPGGRAALVWGQTGAVFAAIRAPGGPFRTAYLEDGSVLRVFDSVAVAPSGRALAAFGGTDGHLRLAVRRPGHLFLRARDTGRTAEPTPVVAVGSNGWGLAVWTTPSGPFTTAGIAALVTPRGTLQALLPLGPVPSPTGVQAQHAVVDGRGAAVAWANDRNRLYVTRAVLPRGS